jgi:hypothetical protein
MKHDSKTHIDRQEKLIGNTAERSSRPDKVFLPTFFNFFAWTNCQGFKNFT